MIAVLGRRGIKGTKRVRKWSQRYSYGLQPSRKWLRPCPLQLLMVCRWLEVVKQENVEGTSGLRGYYLTSIHLLSHMYVAPRFTLIRKLKEKVDV